MNVIVLGAGAMGCLYGAALHRAGETVTLVDVNREHLDAINATLDPHERLQCLVLTATPWSVDNDLITPTFKVKRQRIETVYADRYEEWSASGRRVVWAG